MAKLLFSLFLVLQGIYVSHAQSIPINSLKANFYALNDTQKIIDALWISEYYVESNADSSLKYAEIALNLAEKLDLQFEQVNAFGKIGYVWMNQGNTAKALQSFLSAIKLLITPRAIKNILGPRWVLSDDYYSRSDPFEMQRLCHLSRINQYMGILFTNVRRSDKAWWHSREALRLANTTENGVLKSLACLSLGRLYSTNNLLDSALIMDKEAIKIAKEIGYTKYLGSMYLTMGRTYLVQGDVINAKKAFLVSMDESLKHDYQRGVIVNHIYLAKPELIHNQDSILFHLNHAMQNAIELNAPDLLVRCNLELLKYYESTHQTDSIVKYQRQVILLNDRISENKQQFQNVEIDFINEFNDFKEENLRKRNRLSNIIFTLILSSIIVIGFIIFRSYKNTKRDKALIEKGFQDLKNTQSQLIHAEKMASLGELTAGIAHEIQNPLNFVNNFSEVNKELISDITLELNNGNLHEVKSLLTDIQSNSEKINTHGLRASSIVKNMLDHSHRSSIKKEVTDINKLCNEFLNLSYHGLRAKDKLFNVAFKTDLDPNIPNIKINSQEIGRVILNIVNNAFHACNEKIKISVGHSNSNESIEGIYHPLVTISTSLDSNYVKIIVTDNGIGINDKIKDKIFQPFFTTKPAGQGTGLGLSLSYDIIKEHEGTITVESNPMLTRFIIQLPV